jgi:hypothetical protein
LMTFQSDVSVSRHQTSLAPWGSKGPRNQGGESDRICVSCLLVVFPCHAACCKCKLCSPSLLYISSCMPHVKYSSCSRSIYTGLKFDVTKSKTFFGGFLTIGRRFCHSFTASIAGTFSPHLRTRGKRSTTHSFSPTLPSPPQRRHSIIRTLRTTYILPLYPSSCLRSPPPTSTPTGRRSCAWEVSNAEYDQNVDIDFSTISCDIDSTAVRSSLLFGPIDRHHSLTSCNTIHTTFRRNPAQQSHYCLLLENRILKSRAIRYDTISATASPFPTSLTRNLSTREHCAIIDPPC